MRESAEEGPGHGRKLRAQSRRFAVTRFDRQDTSQNRRRPRGGRKRALVYSVYSSALSSSLTASLPPALTTLPLWSTVEVWPTRALLKLPVAVHVPLAGL